MGVRYFAMVGGERIGPLDLEALPENGVGPDTYIWHKGLPDWIPARDDAGICRMMRRRLAGIGPNGDNPTSRPNEPDETEDNLANYSPQMRRYVPKDSEPLPPPGSFNPDTSRPPVPLTWLALLTTLFCFPPIGVVGLWFALKSRHAWDDAWRAEQGFKHDADSESLRRQAHEYARMAKMWIGITFFLGFIMIAFLMIY